MSRLLLVSGIALWAGLALLLSHLRWFAREPLAARLRPYSPGARPAGAAAGRSIADLVGPAVTRVGERVSVLVGVDETAARRLERIHSPLDATAFRLRQAGWMAASLVVGAGLALATAAPTQVAGVVVLVPPALAFLVLEQQLGTHSSAWQRRLTLEMPVVAEQMATLLGAGWSLGGAINRLADRGTGACAADLARVRARLQQGVSSAQALREWADLAEVDAVDRVVAVLELERDTADLGRLLAEEARAIRRQVHRELLESIERRSQQVWVPVTVATLVPGVIFLAVPFIEALSLYSGS